MRALLIVLGIVVCLGGLIGFVMWRNWPDSKVVAEVERGERRPPSQATVIANTTSQPPPPSTDIDPAVVDLDEMRRLLPDNRYWAEQEPTTDAVVLQRRADAHARRNTLHGKILSGGASTEEIEAYYAERERISKDAIAFAKTALEKYGNGLSQQERGLYELAIKLNGERLAELPRDKADAMTRKGRQEQARADWNAR